MTIEEQQAVARAVVNRIATGRGLPAPWPHADAALPAWLEETDVTTWGVEELGAMRERLLPAAEREKGGVWYTPLQVADEMVRLTVVPQLRGLADPADPAGVLQVLVLDPACGAGVFLVAAARRIVAYYAGLFAAARCARPLPPLIRHLLPEVLRECIFGIDIDPVAIDLAKSVLWLETGGAMPITALDRNLIVGNPLTHPDVLPPAFKERRSQAPHTGPLFEGAHP